MQTVEIAVYQYSELSEKAKQRVRGTYESDEGYPYSDEAMASIRALATHFNGRMMEYAIDFSGSASSARFIMPDVEWDDLEFAARIAALGEFDPVTYKGTGECKLTGYCADEDALDGLRMAFHRGGVRDLEKLMQAAFKTWLAACVADCEDFYSDERFAEHCNANDWLFYEDGQLHT